MEETLFKNTGKNEADMIISFDKKNWIFFKLKAGDSFAITAETHKNIEVSSEKSDGSEILMARM